MSPKKNQYILPYHIVYQCRDRFMSKVIPVTETGCWLWEGCTDRSGYGEFAVSNKETPTARLAQLAHRVSWVLHYGEIPAGLHVLHKCDVPSCVNPDHLFLGTQADNVHDMIRKKRKAVGTALPASKLIVDQVVAIRSRCAHTALRSLAHEYGVQINAICDVVHGKTWAHVTPQKATTILNPKHHRKLCTAQVLEIRELAGHMSVNAISRKFHANWLTIDKIIKRRSWQHI